MKRILYMHHVSYIGGGSYCLLNILKEVDRAKIVPIVALGCDGPLRQEIEKIGIEVVIFKDMITIPYNQSLLKLSTIKRYRQIKKSLKCFDDFLKMQACRINVVYLNNMMLYPYLKVAKKYGLKTIIHIREHWPHDEHIKQLHWAQEIVQKYADRVVAINQFSASMFPDAADKTAVVYDWIDFSDRYEYRPFDEIFGENSNNLKVYLYTGGLLRIKGALQVVSGFHEYVTDKDARLLAMGVGFSSPFCGLKHILKCSLSFVGLFNYDSYKLYKLVNADNRIRCIDNTYLIQHIMQQSYCFLSYYTIPHANLTLAECIINKTVCLAASTPESIEYSKHGRLAYLFQINNIKSLYHAIDEMNSSYSKMKTRLQDESIVIEKLFDRERNSQMLDRVYESL